MTALALARWTLAEHARRPGTWVAAVLLASAWPAALSFGRLGLTTRHGPLSTHAFEVVFLAALLGVSLGVATLARGSWFLERADPVRRVAAEAGGLVGGALLPLGAAWIPAALLAPDASGARSAEFAFAACATALHVLALGLVVLRLPSAPALRSLLVPLLAWVLPALAVAALGQGTVADALGRVVLNLCDASRHGRLGLELGLDWAHRWWSVLPICALGGASCLLALRAPSVHALRHPR